MIYVVKENGLDEPYFAVSSYLSRCSYYADSPDLALQDLITSGSFDHELLEFEQRIFASSAYTVLASYSPEGYPEYFI